MKAKKALKKLARAEALLSEVLDQFAPAPEDVREVLGAAKQSTVSAREAVERLPPPAKPRKKNSGPAAKAASMATRKRATGNNSDKPRKR